MNFVILTLKLKQSEHVNWDSYYLYYKNFFWSWKAIKFLYAEFAAKLVIPGRKCRSPYKKTIYICKYIIYCAYILRKYYGSGTGFQEILNTELNLIQDCTHATRTKRIHKYRVSLQDIDQQLYIHICTHISVYTYLLAFDLLSKSVLCIYQNIDSKQTNVIKNSTKLLVEWLTLPTKYNKM